MADDVLKVAVIGTGYVGLVAGSCLSEIGHQVSCVDKDPRKIETLLAGGLPIYEPGLQELIPRNVKAGRLRFTTDFDRAVSEAAIVIIAVGTPPADDGSANLAAVFAVADAFGAVLDSYKVLVVKSTVPVGTCQKVQSVAASRTKGRFDVVSNPEFLREGVAVPDFLSPDRIVIGSSSEEAQYMMKRLYAPLAANGAKLLAMDQRSAELTKYASNAMLATRISFMNDVANLCERVGADVESVRVGLGTDSRIGSSFLRAGVGYGGSCFPKDVQALLHTAREHGYDLRILNAVEAVNRTQKLRMVEVIKEDFGDDLHGRTFALWGLAFKPDTDDMREAPSIEIIKGLVEAGARVRVYDPQGVDNARAILGDTIVYEPTAMACIDDSVDALVLATEWKEFTTPNWSALKQLLKSDIIYDGRNFWDPQELKRAGFTYRGIGRR